LNKHKVGTSFIQLFIYYLLQLLQLCKQRHAGPPPPRPLAARWLENNNMAAMCTPEVAEGGGQLHVVYLLLVALPANHIDFTVAREGNFMIRLRANWVTFPIMQKLEINIQYLFNWDEFLKRESFTIYRSVYFYSI
jgi:hypothetical protein